MSYNTVVHTSHPIKHNCLTLVTPYDLYTVDNNKYIPEDAAVGFLCRQIASLTEFRNTNSAPLRLDSQILGEILELLTKGDEECPLGMVHGLRFFANFIRIIESPYIKSKLRSDYQIVIFLVIDDYATIGNDYRNSGNVLNGNQRYLLRVNYPENPEEPEEQPHADTVMDSRWCLADKPEAFARLLDMED